MALEKAVVPINFAKGLDTKTDDKQVLAGKLLTLENGVFKSPGSIGPRNGYRKLPNLVLGGATATASDKIAAFDNELLQFGSGKMYSYSSSLSKWLDKGSSFSVGVSQTQITRNYKEQKSPDVALNNGVIVYAWSEVAGPNVGVRASAYDLATGAAFIVDFPLSSTGTMCRCVSIGSFIYVMWVDGANINAAKLDPTSPGVFSLLGSIETDAAATPTNFLDVAQYGSAAVLAYHSNAAQTKVVTLNSSCAPTGSTTISHESDNGVFVSVDGSNGDIYVITNNSATGLKCSVLTSALVVVTSATTIDTSVSPLIMRATGVIEGAQNLRIFYEVDASASINVLTKTCTMTRAGLVSAVSVLKRSVGLGSKAFSYSGGSYVVCSYQSALQSTHFLVRADGKVIAKAVSLNAGGHPYFQILPSVVLASSTQAIVPLPIRTKFASNDTEFFTFAGVVQVGFEFQPSNSNAYARLGDNLHVTGGFLSMYDGVSSVEHGFHFFPENPVTAPTQSTLGNLGDGTYTYYYVYEWMDNRGQLHRSAPSVGQAVTITAGGGTASTVHLIPTLRITDKVGSRSNVNIAVYRTLSDTDGGSTAYRCRDAQTPLYNDTTVDSVSFTDTVSDAAIQNNEILYTSGGVVENIAPPAPFLIEQYKNRLIVIPSEDQYTLWYSKQRNPGEGIAFFDLFVGRVDQKGGPITAIKTMDDKLIIFKRSLIFVMAGGGPLDTGEQNDFTDPVLVNTDVGCVNPKSIVLTPMGLMFMSTKGIYLLDRSLQVQYIGAPVEIFNSQNITDATLLEDVTQVRFLTDSGVTLIYDYFMNEWGTFTNHTGKSACIWNGVYIYLRTDGSVYKEDPTYFLDDTTVYNLKAVTAWIKMDGLQGYQRVRRFAILGQYYSAHTLNVSAAYNYESTPLDSYTFASSNVPADDGVYQFRGHLKHQKCEAIQFTIVSSAPQTVSQNYALSDLSLEIGLKQGLNKLRSSKSVG